MSVVYWTIPLMVVAILIPVVLLSSRVARERRRLTGGRRRGLRVNSAGLRGDDKTSGRAA